MTSAFDRISAVPPPPAEVAAAPAVHGTRKYTVRLDVDEADRFDQLMLEARRRSGRLVEKSDLVRALIDLATRDEALLDRLLTVGRRDGTTS